MSGSGHTHRIQDPDWIPGKDPEQYRFLEGICADPAYPQNSRGSMNEGRESESGQHAPGLSSEGLTPLPRTGTGCPVLGYAHCFKCWGNPESHPSASPYEPEGCHQFVPDPHDEALAASASRVRVLESLVRRLVENSPSLDWLVEMGYFDFPAVVKEARSALKGEGGA